ncbi:pimeloyl-ACP methyl ester esterase BioH [Thalassotalea sp. PLHSN55]|uniref:pimeloyl-ACP methyl ester esterase BioH n=1 Tax=Thalassotalea sp. PLHSN55 TaxID=3435888 RepID=UPI003F8766EA
MAETLNIASYGQGIPLVFIHGWGLNSGIWQELIEPLSQNFQVITVDLPGFGNNVEHELSNYSLDNVVNAIAESVAKPAVYIGWSLGGLVATRLASLYPKKALALITIASSPCFLEKDNWPGIKANILAGFHRMLSEDTQKTIDNFLKIQAMGSEHIRQDIKRIRALIMTLPLPNKTTLDDSLALLETVDLRAELEPLSLPMLRLYGKLDSLVPKIVTQLVSELQPSSQQHIFEKASHAPFISHQQEFLEVLSTWLAKQHFDG